MNLTLDVIVNFWLIGLIANFLGFLLVQYIISNKIKEFNKNEYIELNKFMRSRAEFIKYQTPRYKVELKRALAILPFYTFGLSTIFIYWMFKKSGLEGLIVGAIEVEKRSIIQTVKYKVVTIDPYKNNK